jgi:hypothetical protein
MTIDFMAKITEEYKSEFRQNSEFNLQVSTGVEYKAFWSPVSVNFNASLSYKHSSSYQQSNRFSTEATINVQVRAVQDGMPGGLSKILQILENSIKSQQLATAQNQGAPTAAVQ